MHESAVRSASRYVLTKSSLPGASPFTPPVFRLCKSQKGSAPAAVLEKRKPEG